MMTPALIFIVDNAGARRLVGMMLELAITRPDHNSASTRTRDSRACIVPAAWFESLDEELEALRAQKLEPEWIEPLALHVRRAPPPRLALAAPVAADRLADWRRRRRCRRW